MAIIGNVINNALEAVQGLDLSQRRVKISFQKDPLDYIFEFINPLPQNSPNSPEFFLKEGFTTKKEEGRGNGLFIVKRLTVRMEGSIAVDTSMGLFKITIEIPRHKLEED